MFEVRLSKKAGKFLNSLNEPDYSFLRNKLKDFAENPDRFKVKAIVGTPYYRVRFDNFMVIYTKDVRIINIEKIDRLKDVYRRLSRGYDER